MSPGDDRWRRSPSTVRRPAPPPTDHRGTFPATALPGVVQVARFREPATVPGEVTNLRSRYAALRVLVRPGPVRRWALVVAPLFWFGAGTAQGPLTPMLVDAGWSLSRVGVTVNVLSAGIAVTGALVAGRLTARHGLRWGLRVGAATQAVALLALLPVATGSASVVAATVGVCLLELAFAVAATTAGATAMGLCRAATAGADYATVGTVALVVSFTAAAAGVALAGTVGYGPVLLAAAAAALLSQVALRWFWRSAPLPGAV